MHPNKCNTNTNSNCNCDLYADFHSNCDCYRNADSDTQCYTNSYSYGYGQAHTYCQTEYNTEASTYFAAAPVTSNLLEQ